MHSSIWDDLESGRWAELNPARCPCRGRGWLSSEFDTLHRCPVHSMSDDRHPEDDRDDADVGTDADRPLRLRRLVYRAFQERSGLDRRSFRREVERVMVLPADRDAVVTAQAWVDAAEQVAEQRAAERAEAAARRAGYSCALEHGWALEAEREQREYRR